MGAYLVRRILLMLLMLFLVSVAVFILFSLVPTDPARLTCGKTCTPEIIEANRVRLGLADPLYIQWWEWFKGLFVGRTYAEGTPVEFTCPAPALGFSFQKSTCVTELIVDRLPVTIQLAAGAFVIWMVVGDPVRHLRGPAPRQVAGPHHRQPGPGGLLVPHVLHRPRPALLRRHQVEPAALPGLRATHRGPRPVVPDDAPAVDHRGDGLRGLLHPAHPHPDARDPRRGLHPHGARQGPAGAGGDPQARLPSWPHAAGHRRRTRPRRASWVEPS